jgi:hypothetical protein
MLSMLSIIGTEADPGRMLMGPNIAYRYEKVERHQHPSEIYPAGSPQGPREARRGNRHQTLGEARRIVLQGPNMVLQYEGVNLRPATAADTVRQVLSPRPTHSTATRTSTLVKPHIGKLNVLIPASKVKLVRVLAAEQGCIP